MKIKFVSQDCWIGLYWKSVKHERNDNWQSAHGADHLIITTFYLCIIPCFPIIIDWWSYGWYKLDICDRCANMKVEELKSMTINGNKEFWCKACIKSWKPLNDQRKL